MRSLIIGATGNVGRQVVHQLCEQGAVPRALVRDVASAGLPAAAELVSGDLTAPDTLESALAGVDAVFLMWPFLTAEHAPPVVAAIARHVSRVVYLSSAGVRDDVEHQGDPINQFHSEVERLIEQAGPEWTFVRAGSFATNSLGWAESIRAGGVVREPYGAAAKAPIHERDIAAVAVRALTGDDLVGSRPVLTGPESLTLAEQVGVVGDVLGVPVRFEEIPTRLARAEMIETGWPAEAVDGLLAAYAEMAAGPAPVTGEAERITGRPALSFREWVADHAADFRSSS